MDDSTEKINYRVVEFSATHESDGSVSSISIDVDFTYSDTRECDIALGAFVRNLPGKVSLHDIGWYINDPDFYQKTRAFLHEHNIRANYIHRKVGLWKFVPHIRGGVKITLYDTFLTPEQRAKKMHHAASKNVHVENIGIKILRQKCRKCRFSIDIPVEDETHWLDNAYQYCPRCGVYWGEGAR